MIRQTRVNNYCYYVIMMKSDIASGLYNTGCLSGHDCYHYHYTEWYKNKYVISYLIY